MITDKATYKKYLEQDQVALFQNRKVGIKEYFKNDVFRFQRLLRKAEYLKNCKSDPFSKILYWGVKFRLRNLQFKLGFSIPENVFAEGLAIVHYGTIVISPKAVIGRNCRLHVCTNIGADAKNGSAAPRIGDNVYIGPGAKLFGNIVIGDNTIIGANAVVNKSFPNGNCTIGGVPAKVISDKGSSDIFSNLNNS